MQASSVVTYGLIEAGQHGWSSLGALVPLFAGLLVIVAFFLWEHLLERRPGGQPLLDLSLFHSPSFTWGVILFAVLTLALIGLLFTMPQYFQGVMGTSPEGSGVRLLPAVGGMLLGLLPSARLAKAIGAKLTAAAGFLVLGIGLGIGTTTSLSSGEGFVAFWSVIVGIGTGAHDGRGRLCRLGRAFQRAGWGGLGSSPVAQEHRSPTRERHHWERAHFGLRQPSPPRWTSTGGRLTVRGSVFGGVAVAQAPGSKSLATSVRAAFVHGIDAALLVSVGFALVGLVLTLVFLPGTRPAARRGGRRNNPGRERLVA